MHVHLVDGTYELFRCFYGAPPSKSPSGQEVGAVRGLLATLMGLLRSEGTTHVAVAFDTVIESFRNDLFAGYKTGAGIDANLWAQFPIAEEATRALGLVTWSMIEFECDDALAAYAHRIVDDAARTGASDVSKVFICSPDKDLCQCVRRGADAPTERAGSPEVVLFDRKQDKILDVDAVHVKFGVPPRSIPDLLALVGDAADGIPGIPGFGMKTAAALLARYGTIEDIPDDVTKWDVKVRGADKLAPVLAAHRKEARLYKTLATLRTDIPQVTTAPLEDLAWQGPNSAKLEALAEKLGDKDGKLIDRVSALAAEKLG
jgi:5'-3' exonuclease